MSDKLVKMYDLHTHTIFSDGALTPSELARRAMVAGYGGVALTDHADLSNLEFIVTNILRFKEAFNVSSPEFKVLTGVELTHVLPQDIEPLTAEARDLGADIVIVHGETIIEPVAEGTNFMAIESGVDILAHPGLITEDDVINAAERGVYLELSTRKGHSYGNGHVAKLALKHNAKMVVNNDYHAPGDGLSIDLISMMLAGVGLSEEESLQVVENNAELFNSKI